MESTYTASSISSTVLANSSCGTTYGVTYDDRQEVLNTLQTSSTDIGYELLCRGTSMGHALTQRVSLQSGGPRSGFDRPRFGRP